MLVKYVLELLNEEVDIINNKMLLNLKSSVLKL